jgi:pimeloyl-ACP methyl ester carboxylesterase
VRSLATLVAGLLALAACSPSDATLDRAEDAPTTTTSSTTAPVADAPVAEEPSATTRPSAPVPDVTWTACGTAECATVAVPLDHDDPTGPTIDLSVLRLPARGDRIGALFVNFGGAGSSAVDRVARFSLPNEVRERFDIVAVDPRGVGGSTPLACGVDPAELYSVDPTVEDEADAVALVAISEAYARDCAQDSGELLPHVGTRDVARDFDLVRAGMGDERIDYLGFSYGTSIGQVYAELFPDRVRTMILDGVVDPAPTGIDVAVQQAMGFEIALARWASGCGDRPSCDLGDPVAAVEAVLAAAEAGIPGGGRVLGPGEASIGLTMPLYHVRLWPALDAAVGNALAGDGRGMLALADQYLRLVDFSAYFAVSCLDNSWPSDPGEHLDAASSAATRSPHFGEAIVNDYLRCAVWATEPDPLGPITAEGAPPILVVSTTGDPATPHENGVTVAERLATGVLLTHEGDGHTIVFDGNDCVDRLVIAYLVDRSVPAAGSRC